MPRIAHILAPTEIIGPIRRRSARACRRAHLGNRDGDSGGRISWLSARRPRVSDSGQGSRRRSGRCLGWQRGRYSRCLGLRRSCTSWRRYPLCCHGGVGGADAARRVWSVGKREAGEGASKSNGGQEEASVAAKTQLRNIPGLQYLPGIIFLGIGLFYFVETLAK